MAKNVPGPTFIRKGEKVDAWIREVLKMMEQRKKSEVAKEQQEK